jgi:precorrin-8X/cobalt-precorrin-8 methylmutase
MRILAQRVDLSDLEPAVRAVVARVIHASADLEFASSMVVSPSAVDAGVTALQAGAAVVADVEMVRHGISERAAHCYLTAAESGDGITRSAAGMRVAAERHPVGAIFVLGCAPTAVMELIHLVAAGRLSPGLVIGTPVGFVGAAESKAALRASGLPAITNMGEKGGSAVAAAAFNAVAGLAGRG